jgi:hypothetical protein
MSAAARKDDDVATVMFFRLALALEIMTDMRGWPAGIVAGLTAPQRGPRSPPAMARG